MDDLHRLGYPIAVAVAPAALALPAGTAAATTVAWLVGRLRWAGEMLHSLVAAALRTPGQITTHYIGEELRGARANLETDWRFRKRPALLTINLLSHGSLFSD